MFHQTWVTGGGGDTSCNVNGVLEIWNIVIALRMWVHFCSHSSIQIFCDNLALGLVHSRITIPTHYSAKFQIIVLAFDTVLEKRLCNLLYEYEIPLNFNRTRKLLSTEKNTV